MATSLSFTGSNKNVGNYQGFSFYLTAEGASEVISEDVVMSSLSFPEPTSGGSTDPVYLNVWEGDGSSAYTYLGSSNNADYCSPSKTATWRFNGLTLSLSKKYLVLFGTSASNSFTSTTARVPVYSVTAENTHTVFGTLPNNPPSGTPQAWAPQMTLQFGLPHTDTDAKLKLKIMSSAQLSDETIETDTFYVNNDTKQLFLGSKLLVGSSGGSLPSQSGNSGKFLTTNGTDASWSNIIEYISGNNININPKGIAGYVGSNTSIDANNILTCTSTTDACVVLPSSISNLNNSSITSFTLMLKVYVSGTSYSGQKIFSLFGGKVWSANYQAGIETYGTSKPTITPAQDAWFRVTKSSGTITMEYHLDGETEWTTILSRSGYSSTSWVGDWVLGSPENGSTYNGLKFYLPECYLEIDGVEVWRGYDSTSNYRTINLCKNNGYLKNTATGADSLSIAGSAGSLSNSVNIGYNSSAMYYATALGFGAGAGGQGMALGARAHANGTSSIAIGNALSTSYRTETNGNYSISIGYNAQANATDAIQLGTGTNASQKTLQVFEYQLLNGTTGKIPGARMSLQDTTAPTTSTAGSVGQFYVDTTNQTGYMCVGIDDTDPNNVIYTWKQITV